MPSETFTRPFYIRRGEPSAEPSSRCGGRPFGGTRVVGRERDDGPTDHGDGRPGDGQPSPATLALLRPYSRGAPLGGRVLRTGTQGWDVAALQFSLAWHGFASGTLDGRFGSHTQAALRLFQAWAGL